MGNPACPVEPGLIYGDIIMDASFSLTPANVLAIKTQLQAKTLLAGKDRIFPLPQWEDITDNQEEPTEEKLGLGTPIIVREGKQSKTVRFIEGGLCLLKNLRTFNTKKNLAILHIAKTLDGKYQFIGTLDSSGNLRGMSLNQFFAYPIKLQDGKTANQYRAKITEESPSDWDNYAVVVVDFNPLEEIKGVLDLVLTAATPSIDTVDITVKTKCDSINVYDDLGDLLADPDAWTATFSDGTIKTITSVEKVAGTKAFKIYIDMTSGAETGVYTISLATPVALAALGIGGGSDNGYESNTVDVTLTYGS